jgi:SHOCT-like protein
MEVGGLDQERVMILRMVSDGKLTTDQAEELLEALAPKAEAPKSRVSRWGPDPEEDDLDEDWTETVGDVVRQVIPEVKREVKRTIRMLKDGGLMGRRGYRRVRVRRGHDLLSSNPSVEQLVELANHGVDADFIRELRSLGLDDLSMDNVVELADHGVDPDFVKDLRRLGYVALTTDDLIELVDHGVDTDFIEELHDAGLKDLPLPEVIELADHGIDPETIGEYRKVLRRTDPGETTGA